MQSFCHQLSIVVLACLFVLSSTGCAEFDPAALGTVLGEPTPQESLDEPTVARGLREALKVGVRRAIESVARQDGFWGDELIRIYLPEELQEMVDVLRRIGFARQINQLELAMNRSAEQASGEALDVFVDAISAMTISDAFGILRGGDTAATDYLQDRTTLTLRQRFQPIIEQKMQGLQLYRSYNRLADAYNALPHSRQPAVRLDSYLTDQALDGLFHKLADEERKIREDPLARTTELLRRVFKSR